MSRSQSHRRRNEHGVAIAEFDGCTVAYLPDEEGAWISGWVDVPR